jgi:serine/threonine-protein phosphatase 5
LYFGADITQKFLAKNGFELLVRSHECVDAGIAASHSGQVITLFSAPNYCGVQNNLGAILRFPGGELPEGIKGVEALEKVPLQGEVIQYGAIKHQVHSSQL